VQGKLSRVLLDARVSGVTQWIEQTIRNLIGPANRTSSCGPPTRTPGPRLQPIPAPVPTFGGCVVALIRRRSPLSDFGNCAPSEFGNFSPSDFSNFAPSEFGNFMPSDFFQRCASDFGGSGRRREEEADKMEFDV